MITLLTDFGVADYFVPAVKGAILTIHPEARIVDLTHDIIEHDIESAAFTLGACYRDFPAGTIHVAVVDPGVGSERRAIVVEAGGQIFVGPDNGIFSHVYAREADVRVFEITREELFRHPVSPTFHGRDLFAPIAAHLRLGRVQPAELGARIDDYARIELAAPQAEPRGRVRGCLIQVDRFGNCVTNLTARELRLNPAGRPGPQWMLTVGGHRVTRFGTHFAESRREGELIAYPGSAGYWEIGVYCASAAAVIDARRGMGVLLEPRWI
ncbi:MAG: SAM-dependent chlorinase/fluorinase [Blastocatellia bacterium]|nr:SAM-dependent chlorinase/fluorinase [Blastocatellia bacterium]